VGLMVALGLAQPGSLAQELDGRAQTRLEAWPEAACPRALRSQSQFAWMAHLPALVRHKEALDLLQTYPCPACRAVAGLVPENARSLAKPRRLAARAESIRVAHPVCHGLCRVQTVNPSHLVLEKFDRQAIQPASLQHRACRDPYHAQMVNLKRRAQARRPQVFR